MLHSGDPTRHGRDPNEKSTMFGASIPTSPIDERNAMSTTYFGRTEHDGRRLGADFDLLAKWTRACSLDHPIHSYYLTQLSDNDRAQLFTGPAKEFRLEEGPNNTVKLETLQDEVNRLDSEVIKMIRSANYQRSEARRFEMLNEIEDAQTKADGAAALVLSKALLRGVDGPAAEKVADDLSSKILDFAGLKVKARWKAARDERLKGVNEKTPNAPNHVSANGAIDEATGSDTSDSTATQNTMQKRRQPSVLFKESPHGSEDHTPAGKPLAKAKPDTKITTAFDLYSSVVGDNRTSPRQNLVYKSASPNSSVPDYGSETSSDSAHWNSPRCSAGESPSSPDLDSEVGFFDEADGGVALLSTGLVEELGLEAESDVATPSPAPRYNNLRAQAIEGHLGAGLSQAFFAVPTNVNSMAPTNTFVNSFHHSGPVDTSGMHNVQVLDTLVGQNTKIESSTSPFSPNSKTKNKYPLAKEQPSLIFPTSSSAFMTA